MPSFIVDPFLVTVPSLTGNDVDLRRWLLSLDAWSAESGSSPFQWGHFYASTQALFLADRFASFLAMRSVVQHGLILRPIVLNVSVSATVHGRGD